MQPDLAEAHNNLGNLLAGRKAYAEAAHHFEQAIASDPNYVEARHSYGVVLALMQSYPQAVAELEAVIRLAPQLAQAHLDLADVLAAMGRREGGARAVRGRCEERRSRSPGGRSIRFVGFRPPQIVMVSK